VQCREMNQLKSKETFEASPELEAILLESIAQGERGETIPAEDLIRELRSRE
jgi:acetylornithine/succinyldiaminopimelate/putrescine aminotransferase